MGFHALLARLLGRCVKNVSGPRAWRARCWAAATEDHQQDAQKFLEPPKERLIMIRKERIVEKSKTRLETMINSVKNHKVLSVILFIGVTIGALASFTKALDTLFEIGSKVIVWQAERTTDLATIIVGHIEQTNAEFSVINARADRKLELTGITANQLVSVDLCRSCDFHERTKLNLKLNEQPEHGTALSGEFPLFETQASERIFGNVGVHELAPGESASFSLSISPGDRGSVFHLLLEVNDLKERKQHIVAPPYLFYFIGPPDYRRPSLRVFGFDEWLTSNDVYLRSNTARALGVLTDARALDPLIHAATLDVDASVRAEALLSLAHFNSERSYTTMLGALVEPRLSSLFDTEKSAKIRTAAAKALGDYKDQRAIPYLADTWHRDRGLLVAHQAVESIGKIGGNSAFAVIEKLYHEFDVDPHQEQWRRSSILAAFGYCMDDRARPILLKELARRTAAWDNHFDVQAAAEALRNYPSPETIRALFKAANERGLEEWARRAAIQALIALGAEKEIQELRSAADPEIRSALDDALRAEALRKAF
jgi:HEAT repeat protein